MEVFFVVWMIGLTIAAGVCERAEKKAKRNPPAAGGRTGGRAKAHRKTYTYSVHENGRNVKWDRG